MELIKLTTIKNIKLHNLLQFSFKVAVFIFAVYFIYTRLSDVKDFQKIEFNKSANIYFTVVIILSFFNWTFESLKFNSLLKNNYSLTKIILSVFAGNATSIITPNRLGTFIGRRMILKDRSYPEVITATSIGNIAQLSITLLFGLLGVMLGLSTISVVNDIPLYVTVLIISINLLLFFGTLSIYFNPKRFLKFISKWKLLKKYTELAEQNILENKSDLYLVYLYSFLRYVIFIVQFYLLFKCVSISISFLTTISFVGLLYVLITFVPSAFMGNLGTKEAVALIILGNTYEMSSIFLVSLMIWVVNVAFSALIGSVILIVKK